MTDALITTALWLLAIGAACVPFVLGIWWLDERRWRREQTDLMYRGRWSPETDDLTDDEFRATTAAPA